ncbi:hypothetical protein OJAV_G00013590 [Oryzias javanicus]|uniref:Uncharacterized protein n=1 Tax=Oryzias javanicus TaxID=123683 RepID=A0A437DKM8_ORYJA|nr:hypothetical protein OJAV_G00013590 [Oryzias javanicus]
MPASASSCRLKCSTCCPAHLCCLVSITGELYLVQSLICVAVAFTCSMPPSGGRRGEVQLPLSHTAIRLHSPKPEKKHKRRVDQWRSS